MRQVGLLAAMLALGGCAVAPSVNYRLLSERPRSDAWVPYQLTDTTIVIGALQTGAPPPAGAPGATPGPAAAPILHAELKAFDLTPAELLCDEDGCTGGAVVATAAPIAFAEATFGIEPRRSYVVRTTITPTYFPNSLRLKTLSVEAKDQRKEIIDTLGAFGVGAAKLLNGGGGSRASALGGRKLALPVVLDLAAAKASQTLGLQPLPGNESWGYSIRFLDDPAKAGFLRRSEASSVHGAILTSLCRPLQITLVSGPVTLVMGVVVADPDFLVAEPFPARGSINFGALCGADIQAQPVTETGADALVSDFFSQVQNLRLATAAKRTK